jgi:hypothetical protein
MEWNGGASKWQGCALLSSNRGPLNPHGISGLRSPFIIRRPLIHPTFRVKVRNYDDWLVNAHTVPLYTSLIVRHC